MKISVIIPVYNTEQYLDECIKSVINQTRRVDEIILVDDGSTDNSASICDDYSKNYPYIFTIHQANGGLSKARLAGFELSSGDYIIFLDSDDYIYPDMIEKLAGRLYEDDSDMAMCSYSLLIHEMLHKVFYDVPAIICRDEIIENYIKPIVAVNDKGYSLPGFLPVRLLKKKLIDKSYFVSEKKYFQEDSVFDLLYAKNVQRISVVNEPLYVYRIISNSLSHSYKKNKVLMYEELYRFYKQFFEDNSIPLQDVSISKYLEMALISCFSNACLLKKLSYINNELLSVYQSELYRLCMQHGSIRGSSFRNMVMILLFKYRFFYALFFFNKSLEYLSMIKRTIH